MMDNPAVKPKIQQTEILKEPVGNVLVEESDNSSGKTIRNDHSPARSSVKSFQKGSNANMKSIPKLGGNKLKNSLSKAESKSQSSKTSLPTSEVQKRSTSVSDRKNAFSAGAKTSTNTPNGKSKIPAMKRSSNCSNLQQKNKNSPQKNSLEAASQPLKTVAVRSQVLKKPTGSKPPPPPAVSSTKSNLSLAKSTALEPVKKPSSISRSSFINPISMPIHVNITPKSQSARLAAAALNPTKNKRSASNVSSRNAPPPKQEEEFETNLQKMSSTAGDQNKIENLEKQLETAQTEFLKEIQNLKETFPGKYNCEYKFVSLIRDDESKLIVKEGELCQLPKRFPSASVNDFKLKLRNYLENFFLSISDDLKNSEDTNNADMEVIKKKLDQLQSLKSPDILSYIDDLCAHRDVDTDETIMKLKNDLEESNKALKKSEKNLNDLIKQHKEQILNIEKDLKLRADMDLNKKEEEMKEIQKKLKLQEKKIDSLKTSIQTTEKEYESERAKLNDELQTCRDCLVTANKKLESTEQQIMHEKKELRLRKETIKRLEGDSQEKTKLADALIEMSAKVEELQAKLKDKNKPCKECVEHLKQIVEVKSKVEALESDKAKARQQNEELEKALRDQAKIQEKLKETEQKLQDCQKQLDERENSIGLTPEYTKEVQLEFAKFRQSEAEKRREIEKLKGELSKAQFNMCQLEQQIQRDQQLLDVRSELINSLQTNEKNHRIHMEELFAQVGEKNNTISELNAELQTKSEEFRNLFTTLSAKQMEVANQGHVIKLLEESNERSQMLRVKQEEKIGRMQEELAHLKQTLSIYQANILTGNGGKQFLRAPVIPPSSTNEYNQNFYYYASQRKRKRHVDINVKKYEA